MGTHYPRGLVINGTQFGGAQGIDCCKEVVEHEKKHNEYSSAIQLGAADNAPPISGSNVIGDLLPDSLEAGFGCSTNNKDTFNVAGVKDVDAYKLYGDGEYAVMVHALGKTGNASADWSKGGKRW